MSRLPPAAVADRTVVPAWETTLPSSPPVNRIAVLTSGGDAPGMNAAVRSVVRTAEQAGVEVVAVREGFRGLVDGGPAIHAVGSRDVADVLHRGGTWIGTARSEAFRTREGRSRAAGNLVRHGVDGLVAIGGDGTLTGADVLRAEWSSHLEELVAAGTVSRSQAERHPTLNVVGVVGSIDNDLVGTEMTIGADTALHRITEAIDAIHSTASSHQRSFVIEVMGRGCGYLALMAGLATGAQWAFIPERPPRTDEWVRALRHAVRRSREVGRRQNLVIVAEGARDQRGEAITAEQVRRALADELGEDTRITTLGHVQRGGSPSAFDRNLATLCGSRAVEVLLSDALVEPVVVGLRKNRIATFPLARAVADTHRVAEHLARREFDEALALRGRNVLEAYHTLRTLVRTAERPPVEGRVRHRVLVLHAGAPAPGMNTAVRAAVRSARDAGHDVLAARHGFDGLLAGDVAELGWMDVSGWVSHGGAELGTSRWIPTAADVPALAGRFAEFGVDAVLMIGGHEGYAAAHRLAEAGAEHAALAVPFVCVPATINNDLPATELTIGADTAVNNIVEAVDKINQAAAATRRCYVVEVMGGDSGYLALASALATGAERAYLPEFGISLEELTDDVGRMQRALEAGRPLGLVIRSEAAEDVYTTPFLLSLFAKEAAGAFEVGEAILGHLQQGGDPTPFDRIQATRLTVRGVDHLLGELDGGASRSAMLGLNAGEVGFTDLAAYPASLDASGARRPATAAWLGELAPVAAMMAWSPPEG